MQILPEEVTQTYKNPIQLFYEGLTENATRIEYVNKLKKVLCEYLALVLKGDPEKIQNLTSLVYWKLCILLNNFNKQIENEFEITNYIEAISRDFGLSKDYISDMLTIVKIFNKTEIIDSVPFSYYRALKRKYFELKKLSLFEKEKKRLNKMGKENKLPGRENYKEELTRIIKKHSKKR